MLHLKKKKTNIKCAIELRGLQKKLIFRNRWTKIIFINVFGRKYVHKHELDSFSNFTY